MMRVAWPVSVTSVVSFTRAGTDAGHFIKLRIDASRFNAIYKALVAALTNAINSLPHGIPPHETLKMRCLQSRISSTTQMNAGAYLMSKVHLCQYETDSHVAKRYATG